MDRKVLHTSMGDGYCRWHLYVHLRLSYVTEYLSCEAHRYGVEKSLVHFKSRCDGTETADGGYVNTKHDDEVVEGSCVSNLSSYCTLESQDLCLFREDNF